MWIRERAPQVAQSTVMELRIPPAAPGRGVGVECSGARSKETTGLALVTAVRASSENSACFPGTSRSAGAQNRARLPRGSGESVNGVPGLFLPARSVRRATVGVELAGDGPIGLGAR